MGALERVRARAWGLAVALVAAALGAPREARACASCACGDPTLTALDQSIPFAGRLRLALLAGLRSEGSGVPRVSRIEATEQRLSLAVTWSPLDALTLGLVVPVVRRTAEVPSGRLHSGYGVADVEARARWTWSAGPVALRHAWSLTAGADVPTSPELAADGAPLPIEAQPSSGALSGVIGASYALYAYPWSAYVGVAGRASTVGHLDFQAGPALLSTISVQRQLSTAWALGVGVDARLDAAAHEHGADDPHSGGFLALASPEVRWSPTTDLTLSLGVRVPVVRALRGDHDEGVAGLLGAAWDL